MSFCLIVLYLDLSCQTEVLSDTKCQRTLDKLKGNNLS
jgi:hypothetical protein